MHRPRENSRSRLQPLNGQPAADVAGRYWCEELDATLTVTDGGGVLYGGFSGFLGQGRMELLEPIGPDVWALPCPRALDHTPPGDWTLRFQPDRTSVDVGCWLARALNYRRE
jgi:D-aminopeptidase